MLIFFLLLIFILCTTFTTKAQGITLFTSNAKANAEMRQNTSLTILTEWKPLSLRFNQDSTRWSMFGGSRNDGNPQSFLWTDGNGDMRRSPLSALQITTANLASPIDASRGGTGLGNAGSSGQIIMSDGTGFAMTTPPWLTSYTETDPTVPSYSKSLTGFSVIQSLTDLLYKPISYVPAWSDITGKPSFATVATSGAYNDLTGKPTIPAAQVNSDWNAGSGLAQILNKPTLGTAASTNSSDYATAAQGALASTALQSYTETDPTIFSWAKSSTKPSYTYSEISGTPTLGTAASQNSTAFATAAQGALAATALQSEVDGSVTNEIELPSQTGQSGKYLSTNGTTPSWTNVPTASTATNAGSYGAGTNYILTNTSAKVTFGTTSPSITLPSAGTYLIISNLKIQYAGLTTLLNTCNFKLRRINNTAGDIPNATTNFDVVATLLTGTGGDVDIPTVIYTTATSGDIIEMWANRQNGISVTGSIQVGEAGITVVKLN